MWNSKPKMCPNLDLDEVGEDRFGRRRPGFQRHHGLLNKLPSGCNVNRLRSILSMTSVDRSKHIGYKWATSLESCLPTVGFLLHENGSERRRPRQRSESLSRQSGLAESDRVGSRSLGVRTTAFSKVVLLLQICMHCRKPIPWALVGLVVPVRGLPAYKLGSLGISEGRSLWKWKQQRSRKLQQRTLRSLRFGWGRRGGNKGGWRSVCGRLHLWK